MREATEWAAEAVWTGDYRAGLSEMQIPTLILIGQQDYLTPLALSMELLAIPGSRLEIVPDAGHLSNIDNPSDFNRLVEEFIDSHSPISREDVKDNVPAKLG
ncbi:MAG: alpha/beta hydrolase [Pyrinomonadaceae bacterium]